MPASSGWPPAEAIRQRSVEQEAYAVADKKTDQGQVDDGQGLMPDLLEHRYGGQVHIGGQGRKGRQQRQQQKGTVVVHHVFCFPDPAALDKAIRCQNR